MKKYWLEFTLLEIFITLFVYLSASFVSGKLNVMEMSSGSRLFMLFIWCCLTAFSLVFTMDLSDDNEQ